MKIVSIPTVCFPIQSLNSELGEKLKAEMKAILNSHNKT